MLKTSSTIVLVLLFLGSTAFGLAREEIYLNLQGDLSGLSQSHKKKFKFTGASLLYKSQTVPISIKTRGQNCLAAYRKCFSITLKEAIAGLDKKFILASLSQDHGYINYVLGLKFMEEAGVNFIQYKYVHIYINNKSYGLYLMLEKPEQVLVDRKGAVFVGRRSHWPKKDEIKFYDQSTAPLAKKEYQLFYEKMITTANKLKGPRKHEYLKNHMDIESYFNWLATNVLLKNGDYDDELFYYVANHPKGDIYFEFMGWDYEDLFTKQHFVNKFLHPFSIRNTILYSLVQKLDYYIYKDKYEYSLFLQHMRNLMASRFTNDKIKEIFHNVHKEIEPFLVQEVLLSSVKDDHVKVAYTKKYIEDLLKLRLSEVLKRAKDLTT